MEKKWQKEDALIKYKEMVKKSWTYAKLTQHERKQLVEVFESVQTTDALKGSYEHRWEVLQAIYNAFLMALDYTWNWREEQEDMPF